MLRHTTKIQTNGIEIVFQPVSEIDESFLLELFIETRSAEFASLGWGDNQLRQFLGMQYQMQSRSYEIRYPNAEHLLIISDEKIGRLVFDRRDTQVDIVDISLLKSKQNLGIGTSIISRLIADAQGAKLGLVLRVSSANQGARRLYERLGFHPIRQHEMYTEMEWRNTELNV